jgi:hypothetical protein
VLIVLNAEQLNRVNQDLSSTRSELLKARCAVIDIMCAAFMAIFSFNEFKMTKESLLLYCRSALETKVADLNVVVVQLEQAR